MNRPIAIGPVLDAPEAFRHAMEGQMRRDKPPAPERDWWSVRVAELAYAMLAAERGQLKPEGKK